MELQFHRRRGVDPRIQRRRYCRVVGEVGCGRRLGRFDSYPRNVIREALVRPDASRWPPFYRSGAASEFRVNYLLCLGRFSGRKWIEGADGVAGEHVEPRHRLRERLHPEQRAARNVAVVREYSGYERIESVDRRQQTRAGEKSPLEQITTRHAAPRPLADDFPAIVACSFGFDDACPGCVWGEIDRHAAFLLARQSRLGPPRAHALHSAGTYPVCSDASDSEYSERPLLSSTSEGRKTLSVHRSSHPHNPGLTGWDHPPDEHQLPRARAGRSSERYGLSTNRQAACLSA